MQKTIVEMIDDLDGEKADKTLSFSIEGKLYEIDLSNSNAEKFLAEMEPWLLNVRRVGGSKRRKSSEEEKQETKRIRKWAKTTGYEIASRGRIPDHARKAYNKSHPRYKD